MEKKRLRKKKSVVREFGMSQWRTNQYWTRFEEDTTDQTEREKERDDVKRRE